MEEEGKVRIYINQLEANLDNFHVLEVWIALENVMGHLLFMW